MLPWVMSPHFPCSEQLLSHPPNPGLLSAVSRASGRGTVVMLLLGRRLIKNQKPHLGAENRAGSTAGEREA